MFIRGNKVYKSYIITNAEKCRTIFIKKKNLYGTVNILRIVVQNGYCVIEKKGIYNEKKNKELIQPILTMSRRVGL